MTESVGNMIQPTGSMIKTLLPLKRSAPMMILYLWLGTKDALTALTDLILLKDVKFSNLLKHFKGLLW